MDKLSYAWGLAMGAQLKGMGVEKLDVKDYSDAVKSVFDGTDPAISTDEARKIITDFLTELQMKAHASNIEEGKKFLEENAKRDGIKVTDSGLQYLVLKEGTGKSPKATDKVTVHYTGRLLDGTVFDSSVSRGEPATFPLNRVILGWTEGLQLMKEGAKYEFFIPSDLAYGPQGAGQAIPPHSTLIFEVELLKVEDE